jgi:hypothetical protein
MQARSMSRPQPRLTPPNVAQAGGRSEVHAAPAVAAVAGTVSGAKVLRWERGAAAWAARHQAEQPGSSRGAA